MTFERPEFLLALLLACLPAALYLSAYVRSKKESFPAAWHLFGQDMKPLRRLKSRQIVLAFVRIGLVLALALAFAGPVGSTQGRAGGGGGEERRVVVVDGSASMNAVDRGRTRLASAAAKAAAWLAEGGKDARVAMVRCPAGEEVRPEWLPREEAERRLAALAPEWGECDLAALLSELMPRVERSARVLVVGDFSGGELPALAPWRGREWSVQLMPCCEGHGNVGVAGVVAGGEEVRVRLENGGGAAARVGAVLECGGKAARAEAQVPAGGAQEVVLPIPAAAGGLCSVHVGGDAYPADDAVWVEVRQQEGYTVLLVDGVPDADPGRSPAFFISSALRAAMPAAVVMKVGPAEFSSESLTVADLLVLVDPPRLQEDVARLTREYLRQGGRGWLFAGANVLAWGRENGLLPGAGFRACATAAEQPFRASSADWEQGMPAGLSSVGPGRLSGWTAVRHAGVLLDAAGQRTRLRFSDGLPGILEVPVGQGDLVVWTLVPDADNGNFALHPLFPIAVASLLEGRSASPRVMVPESCLCGRPCRVAGRHGAAVYEGGLSGSARLIASSAGEVVCREPGPYFQHDRSGRHLAFSCAVPPAERRLAVADLSKLPRPSAGGAAATNQRRQWYSPWLLAAATLLLLFELWMVTGRYARG